MEKIGRDALQLVFNRLYEWDFYFPWPVLPCFVRLRLVCKQWRHVMDTNHGLWRGIARTRLRLDKAFPIPEGTTPYEFCKTWMDTSYGLSNYIEYLKVKRKPLYRAVQQALFPRHMPERYEQATKRIEQHDALIEKIRKQKEKLQGRECRARKKRKLQEAAANGTKKRRTATVRKNRKKKK